MTELEERKAKWRLDYAALKAETAALAAPEKDLRPIAETFDPVAVLARLRLMAREAGVEACDEPSPVVVDARLARRLYRLRIACGIGADEDKAIASLEPLAAAFDAPPVVEGHVGSAAASAAVVSFLAHPTARTLLLRGPSGHGKTWAATWALASRDGAVLVAADDIRVGDSWGPIRDRAALAPLLVFDELGQEGVRADGSPWYADEASKLLEARQTRGRPTIITANLPMHPTDVPAHLAAQWKGRTITERYGDRLRSRLTDARLGMIIRVQGAQSIREMAAR